MSDDFNNPTRINTNDPMSHFYHGYDAPPISTASDIFVGREAPGTDTDSSADVQVLPSKGLILYFVAIALLCAIAAPYIFN